ncbi:hypothetical protein GCM10010430_50420 [Kitasatospora cystarginea]|uniref:Integrase n=1 Tax=Kitasatospora cystarginea TaxID=58350 RepID=A0ABN3EIW9_9ACTN
MPRKIDGDRTVSEEAEFGLERCEGERVRESSVNQYERRLHLSTLTFWFLYGVGGTRVALPDAANDLAAEERDVVLRRTIQPQRRLRAWQASAVKRGVTRAACERLPTIR